jgi:hypothetical protein
MARTEHLVLEGERYDGDDVLLHLKQNLCRRIHRRYDLSPTELTRIPVSEDQSLPSQSSSPRPWRRTFCRHLRRRRDHQRLVIGQDLPPRQLLREQDVGTPRTSQESATMRHKRRDGRPVFQ